MFAQLLHSRPVVWVRGIFELAGAISLLGSLGGATVLAIVVPAVLAAILSLPSYLLVVLGIGVFFVALSVILAILNAVLRRRSVTNPGEAESNASQQDASNPYPLVQEHEIPQLLATRWVQGRSLRIEQFIRQGVLKLRRDVSVQLNQMRFVDCEIYGPAILAPVESPIGGKTFVNCSWDEDLWHRWKGSSEGRYYVGTIRLQDCVFQDCHFRGVGLVLIPDEYDEQMKKHGLYDEEKVSTSATGAVLEAPEVEHRSDDDLKQRCQRMADELFRLSKERDEEDPRNKPGWKLGNPFSEDPESRNRAQEQKRYDDETWTQYRRQYEGELRTLLDTLQRREWLEPKEHKEIQNELVGAIWRTPSQRIERVAARLDAFGKRL